MDVQSALFHEDFTDALQHQVKALGGVEAVGVEIWRDKSRKAAGAWLSDCLNPKRSAKLSLTELVLLLRMGRDAGIMCAFEQLAIETDTEIKAASPTSQRSRLLEQQMQLMRQMQNIQKDIDRMDAEGEMAKRSNR